MTNALPVGQRYDVNPIPPIAENTTYYDAGPVSIGLEYRHLTDQILDTTYNADDRTADIIGAARPESIDDEGVSFHVCASDRTEYIRFDVFADDPHYHYIAPGEYNIVVPYDRNASGDMLEWVFRCFAGRLPDMLRFIGATDLAEQVDQSAIDAIVPTLRQAANERIRLQPA